MSLDGTTTELGPDASTVLPAGVERQLINRSVTPAVAMVCSHSGARASTALRADVSIPWAE